MTEAFKDMLYLLGGGACGHEVSAENIDMEQVHKKAKEQGVWQMVYKAAEKTADVSRWKAEYLLTVGRSTARTEFTLGVIKKLEDEGVRCCLLKGAAAARFYDVPDLRISADTDILIDPRDEKRIEAFLKNNGYSVTPRGKNGHHLKARHPVGGLLEAHVRAYSELSSEIVFNGRVKYSTDYEKAVIYGKELYVMNPNDELTYLTAHYIKHLINGGCGIRQVLDLLLCMDKNGANIDFDRYYSLMRELRYDKLIDVIKTIGAKYFGFDYPIENEELAEKLLTDIENGGTFGFLADDRANFCEMYCARRRNWSKRRMTLYMWFKNEQTIFNKLFPNRRGMLSRGYAYAKNPVLLPVAWIHRFFDLRFHPEKNHSGVKSNSAKTEKRLEMMKDFGMID